MTRPVLARGSVVSRGGRVGVVWQDHGRAGIDLFQVLVPREDRLNDVLLTFGELIACGAPVAHMVVRPVLVRVPADRQAVAGTAPGPLMCRIVAALLREMATAATEQRWRGAAQHTAAARSRPVNLVAA